MGWAGAALYNKTTVFLHCSEISTGCNKVQACRLHESACTLTLGIPFGDHQMPSLTRFHSAHRKITIAYRGGKAIGKRWIQSAEVHTWTFHFIFIEVYSSILAMRLAAIFALAILLENYTQDISINTIKQDIRSVNLS